MTQVCGKPFLGGQFFLVIGSSLVDEGSINERDLLICVGFHGLMRMGVSLFVLAILEVV